MRLRDKVTMVTGAGSSIGWALANLFLIGKVFSATIRDVSRTTKLDCGVLFELEQEQPAAS
jgi:NAD(P)-dependent dehydrogenase (short-subunit alcohol dehydrogenase family)